MAGSPEPCTERRQLIKRSRPIDKAKQRDLHVIAGKRPIGFARPRQLVRPARSRDGCVARDKIGIGVRRCGGRKLERPLQAWPNRVHIAGNEVERRGIVGCA